MFVLWWKFFQSSAGGREIFMTPLVGSAAVVVWELQCVVVKNTGYPTETPPFRIVCSPRDYLSTLPQEVILLMCYTISYLYI